MDFLHRLLLFLQFLHLLNAKLVLTSENESKGGDIFESMSKTMIPGCTQVFGRHFSKKRLEPSIIRAITTANQNRNPVVILRKSVTTIRHYHFLFPEHEKRSKDFNFKYYQGFTFNNAPQCRSFFIAENSINFYQFIYHAYLKMEVSFVNDYFIIWEIDNRFLSVFQIHQRSFRKAVVIRDKQGLPKQTEVLRECLFRKPRERNSQVICSSEINDTVVKEAHQINAKLMFPDFPKNLNQTVLVTGFNSNYKNLCNEEMSEYGYSTLLCAILMLVEKGLNAEVRGKDIPWQAYVNPIYANGMLRSRQIDFVLRPCTISCTDNNWIVMNGDFPFAVAKPLFFIRKPIRIFEWTSIVQPFPFLVWGLVFASGLSVYIYFRIVHPREIAAFNAAFYPLIDLGVERCPHNSKFRIFFIFWLLIALVINSAYDGALFSCLMNPTYEKHAESFEDLLTMKYTCYTQSGGLTGIVIAEYSSLGISRSELDTLLDLSVTNGVDILEKVLFNKRRCIITIEMNYQDDVAIYEALGISPTQSVVGSTFNYLSSLCPSRTDILRPTLSRFIININDFGFRNKLIDRDRVRVSFFKGRKVAKNTEHAAYKLAQRIIANEGFDPSKPKPFSLQMIKSAFLFLCCGVGLSIIVVVLEISRNSIS